jgi:hypothetical protein
LPEVLTIRVGDDTFPILWSISFSSGDRAGCSGDPDEFTEPSDKFPEEPALEKPEMSWENEQDVGDSDAVEPVPDEEEHAAERSEEVTDDDLLFVGMITLASPASRAAGRTCRSAHRSPSPRSVPAMN